MPVYCLLSRRMQHRHEINERSLHRFVNKNFLIRKMKCCKHLSCGPRGPQGPIGPTGPANPTETVSFFAFGNQPETSSAGYLDYSFLEFNIGDGFSLADSSFTPPMEGLYQVSFTANFQIEPGKTVTFFLIDGNFVGVIYCVGTGTDAVGSYGSGSCTFSTIVNTLTTPGPFYIYMIPTGATSVISFFNGYFLKELVPPVERSKVTRVPNIFIQKLTEGIPAKK